MYHSILGSEVCNGFLFWPKQLLIPLMLIKLYLSILKRLEIKNTSRYGLQSIILMFKLSYFPNVNARFVESISCLGHLSASRADLSWYHTHQSHSAIDSLSV